MKAEWYWHVYDFLPLMPAVIAGAGVFASLRASRLRWLVHVFVFLLLPLAGPIYAAIGPIFDPTIGDMNMGEQSTAGMILFLYMFTALPTAIVYAIYAWSTRRRPQAAATSS